LEKLIPGIETQLADEASLAKKPQKIVEGMREKLDAYRIERDKLLKAMGS
jgi:hypothetical protein